MSADCLFDADVFVHQRHPTDKRKHPLTEALVRSALADISLTVVSPFLR